MIKIARLVAAVQPNENNRPIKCALIVEMGKFIFYTPSLPIFQDAFPEIFSQWKLGQNFLKDHILENCRNNTGYSASISPQRCCI